MAHELYDKLTQLQWMLHRQQIRLWVENGPMADATHGQGRILAVLKLKDGISTRDLSYLLGVRVSSLNEILSKLEKNGFVFREPSPEDKRVMLVRITEKGKNEQQIAPRDFRDIFSCLSDEEQGIFGEYLDRITQVLRASVGEDDMLEKMEAFRARFSDMMHGSFEGHPPFRGWDPRRRRDHHHCFFRHRDYRGRNENH
ncbi:MAG: MarR family transcriptional regulator [Spirochaetota bacterium]|jgi:DNA-binding MarR family transcriptional regulator|nr:MarR family transcriptional regulator [Spirochaetota bacterium]